MAPILSFRTAALQSRSSNKHRSSRLDFGRAAHTNLLRLWTAAVRNKSDLWLPAGTVLAGPKRLGVRIIDDMAGFGVDVQGVAGAISDVPQMAEQGAFVTVFDY